MSLKEIFQKIETDEMNSNNWKSQEIKVNRYKILTWEGGTPKYGRVPIDKYSYSIMVPKELTQKNYSETDFKRTA